MSIGVPSPREPTASTKEPQLRPGRVDNFLEGLMGNLGPGPRLPGLVRQHPRFNGRDPAR